MYEKETYGVILGRLLARVPDSEDKREGSLIHDALAPAAAELAQAYSALDAVLRLGFGDTSSGSYLERRVSEAGLMRKPATAARSRGLFRNAAGQPFEVPAGSRFSCEGLNFFAVRRLGPGEFELSCETAGAAGNRALGKLLPIDYMNGLAKAELTELLLAGEDEEEDEALRARYLQKVRQPSTSGNGSHYIQWATSVAGVGAAKVTELWNGPGTVKVSIVNSERHPAPSALVNQVAAYIETVRPVCASVNVVSAIGMPIHVKAAVVLAPGASLQKVQESFEARLSEHLGETVFASAYVSYAKLGTLLLGTEGVLDYTSLTVNDKTANVPLADNEVPIQGTVRLGV